MSNTEWDTLIQNIYSLFINYYENIKIHSFVNTGQNGKRQNRKKTGSEC